MLPLSLLRAARDDEILVELTNGETYNGKLFSCDSYMNIVLHDVILTTKSGTRFFHLTECYIRGSTVKCMRLSKDTIKSVPAEEQNAKYNKAIIGSKKPYFGSRGGNNRGNGRGRGRGRGNNRGGGRGSGNGRGR